MPPKRLTREESRERTRQRLLDAAATVIAGQGLAASSVEDIAAQAGYSRGAFYSNFDSKNQLFLEVLRGEHRTMQADLQGLLESELAPAELQRRLVVFYGQRYRDQACFKLWAEARLHALHDADFRRGLNVLQLELRDALASFIARFGERMGLSLPAPAPDLAVAMMALIDGLLSFNLSTPGAMSDEAAERVLGVIFAATFFGGASSR